MYGSIMGNIIGIGYFLAFQALGILFANSFLKKNNPAFRLLIGSVLGSFSLSWFPVLFAVFCGFTVRAHILALAAAVVLCVFYGISTANFGVKKKKIDKSKKINLKLILRESPVLWVLIPLFIFMIIILIHHTLSCPGDGTLHAGQSTFGDMNMHLGFITSIAKQEFFPPEYSLLPGTQLSYPFLADSISSSIYIWGSSLRIAYLLPMVFALGQVFFGAVCITKSLLKKTGKNIGGKTLLAFILFFFNGGLGLWYFIRDGFGDGFTRIFTAFYETPTNFLAGNIQWHNVLCDMLIPQRATLFGWAILFPTIALILRGRDQALDEASSSDTKKSFLNPSTRYFLLAGVLAGGLVLIHTHSFLALGVICAGIVALEFHDRISLNRTGTIPVSYRVPIDPVKPRIKTRYRAAIVLGFLFAMTMLSMAQFTGHPLEESTFFYIGLILVIVFGLVFLFMVMDNISLTPSGKISLWVKPLFSTWGVFLGIVILLALPQLILFTFKQAQGEQFLRGAFNWANNGDAMDSYFIFYLKNLGIVFVLFILMLIVGTKRQIRIVLPSCLLWILCEFFLFQPNPYDNNKLLLVAYLFICIAVADFTWDTVPGWFLNQKQSKQKKGERPSTKSRVISSLIICFASVSASVSAVLTLGREYVSDYELYSKDYVGLCEWVEENTKPKSIFLTANNHNNAVASLTGRNIVCGTGSFLYYHGLDYTQQEADLRVMYEDPAQRDSLLSYYDVDYIVIGPYENSSYAIPDLQEMIERYPVVYNKDGILLLEVK